MISQADNAKVKDTVAAIVAEGQNLRAKVSEVVTDAADKASTTRTGLIDLSRSVLDGAVAALDKSVSRDPDSILRQVIDGLGDGLSTTALATRLAMEEAKAEQKRFAEEDLSTTTRDLRAVGDLEPAADLAVVLVARVGVRLVHVPGARLRLGVAARVLVVHRRDVRQGHDPGSASGGPVVRCGVGPARS